MARELRCSFCGKAKDAACKFIQGPGVYICDACVELCNNILRAGVEKLPLEEYVTRYLVPSLVESGLALRDYDEWNIDEKARRLMFPAAGSPTEDRTT